MRTKPSFSIALTISLPLVACGAVDDSPHASSASAAVAIPSSGSEHSVTTPVNGSPANTSDDDGCSCTVRYTGGQRYPVNDCETDYCASYAELLACEEPEQSCNLAAACTCDCEVHYHEVSLVEDADTLLSGVVDLWQFDYGCDAPPAPIVNSITGAITGWIDDPPNAVGCGPVAAATVLYWWAQRGYDELVEDFLTGTGTGAHDRRNDWQSLVRTLYDDYLFTICAPGGQTAVTPPSLTSGLRDYIEDAGYQPRVGHYKVCADCNVNGTDELAADGGLALVKSELRAGRPVIMGFNVGRATQWVAPLVEEVDGTITVLNSHIGELSNGTPVAGTISHYGVITGYRRFGGSDVILVNLGWRGDSSDVPFLWNPAGKWLHLHTVDIESDSSLGPDWCAHDRGLAGAYDDSADLELSHTGVGIETVLAGVACGIDRDRAYVEEQGAYNYSSGYSCNFRTELEPVEREGDPRFDNLDGNGPVVLEEQDPLPGPSNDGR